MGEVVILGVDVVAAVVTFAYITKLLFESAEHVIVGTVSGFDIKRSLQGQRIAPRFRR